MWNSEWNKITVDCSLFLKAICSVFGNRSNQETVPWSWKRTIGSALGLMPATRFDHMRPVHECHWLKLLEPGLPLGVGAASWRPRLSRAQPAAHKLWGAAGCEPLDPAVSLAVERTAVCSVPPSRKGRGRKSCVFRPPHCVTKLAQTCCILGNCSNTE